MIRPAIEQFKDRMANIRIIIDFYDPKSGEVTTFSKDSRSTNDERAINAYISFINNLLIEIEPPL